MVVFFLILKVIRIKRITTMFVAKNLLIANNCYLCAALSAGIIPHFLDLLS